MKRIVVLCDGTWNVSSAKYPTNVVKLAQAVLPTAAGGTKQIVIYIPGVGTGRGTGWMAKTIDKLGGGAFGHGLIANIEDAYRHLVFTYEPGDEIYILGFSRGAYTARSLAGLIRSSGTIDRLHVARIPEAISMYQARGKDTHPDAPPSCAFRARYSPLVTTGAKEREWRKRNMPNTLPGAIPLQITYLGVWDTVGALGVPNYYLIAGLFNRKYQFHDTDLSRSVTAARHAVALDERRSTFPAALWSNLDELNVGSDERPYKQHWFPGDHGSVGGGGDITGLSDDAMLWIVEGAQERGLEIDQAALTSWTLAADHRAALCNESAPKRGIFSFLMSLRMVDRKGPSYFGDISRAALRRWKARADTLPEGRSYRPPSLKALAAELDRWEEAIDEEQSPPGEGVAAA